MDLLFTIFVFTDEATYQAQRWGSLLFYIFCYFLAFVIFLFYFIYIYYFCLLPFSYFFWGFLGFFLFWKTERICRDVGLNVWVARACSFSGPDWLCANGLISVARSPITAPIQTTMPIPMLKKVRDQCNAIQLLVSLFYFPSNNSRFGCLFISIHFFFLVSLGKSSKMGLFQVWSITVSDFDTAPETFCLVTFHCLFFLLWKWSF